MIIFFGTKFHPQDLGNQEHRCFILRNQDNRGIRRSAAASEEEALHRRGDTGSPARSTITVKLERVS